MRRPVFFLLPALLAACAPAYSARTLHFVPGPTGEAIEPRGLLTRQVVPGDRLVSIQEAVQRAPVGSLLVVCWKEARFDNPWGPCSHLSRKISDTQLTESSGLLKGGINFLPFSVLDERYAVIVVKTPVTPEQLSAMTAEAQHLRGLPYNLSGDPGTYYCTTYQNQLQVAAGLKPVIPLNLPWNAYLPAELLQQPGTEVLWVGVNEQARR